MDPVAVLQVDHDLVGLRVPGRIMCRLAGDEVELRGREIVLHLRASLHLQAAADRVQIGHLLRQAFQGDAQPCASTGTGRPLAMLANCALAWSTIDSSRAACVRTGRARGELARERSGQHADSAHLLPEHIVQLAAQSLPLFFGQLGDIRSMRLRSVTSASR